MNSKIEKTIIAVDPGKSGAIAVFDGGRVFTLSLQNGDEAARQTIYSTSQAANPVAYMEKVGGYVPKKDGEGQPGSRMFVFGEAYGYMRGLIDAYSIPLKLVLPQVWQRGIAGRKGDYNSRKKALHAHAKRLFPKLTFTKEEADALCILHYALFQEGVSNRGYSSPLVANPDDSAAVAWCKATFGEVPAYGSPEFARMVKWHAENVA